MWHTLTGNYFRISIVILLFGKNGWKLSFQQQQQKQSKFFLFVSANDFQWFDAIAAELLNKCDYFYSIYIYRQNDLNTKYTKTELIPISFFAVFFVWLYVEKFLWTSIGVQVTGQKMQPLCTNLSIIQRAAENVSLTWKLNE